jgi:hypothetical protein
MEAIKKFQEGVQKIGRIGLFILPTPTPVSGNGIVSDFAQKEFLSDVETEQLLVLIRQNIALVVVISESAYKALPEEVVQETFLCERGKDT